MPLTCREQIGYLIFRFDGTHEGPRTRQDYLSVADDILQVVIGGPDNFDEVIRRLVDLEDTRDG